MVCVVDLREEVVLIVTYRLADCVIVTAIFRLRILQAIQNEY